MSSRNNITARDVARLAGVSPSTVSRVLSNKDYVSAETQQRVQQAMDELGFQGASSLLSQGESRSLLMITSSLRNHANSYYIDGVESAAASQGFDVFVRQINDAKGELSYNEILSLAKRCSAEGIIFFTDAVGERVMAETAKHFPAVGMLTGCTVPGMTGINLDEYALMKRMVDYLIDCGKQKIALINGQTRFRHFAAILKSYQRVLSEHGLEENPDWIVTINTNYYSTTARIMAEHTLSSPNPPDAFIASADVYAAGAVCACKKLGFDIPQQVSILGRDNTAICHVFDPPITAFDMPMEQIGFTACSNLIERIESPQYTPKNIVMDGSLIIRDSSGMHMVKSEG